MSTRDGISKINRDSTANIAIELGDRLIVRLFHLSLFTLLLLVFFSEIRANSEIVAIGLLSFTLTFAVFDVLQKKF